MAHDVFICHSTKDKRVADAACERLETAEIACWIAPRDALPGREYSEQIVQAIARSRILILLYSQHANESRQVVREVEQASNDDKIILPFRIEDVPPADRLAYYIRSVHWLDASDAPLEALDELVALVQRVLETEPAERRTPVAAPGSGRDTPTSVEGRRPTTTWDDEGRPPPRSSPSAAAAPKRDDEEARLRAASPHWAASAALLRKTLFRSAPQLFVDELIDRILAHFRAGRAGLGDQLFRASRLLIESRIFRAARGEEPESLLGLTPRETVNGLVAALDSILASLERPVAETFDTCFELATIDAAENDLTASCYFEALGEVERECGYTEAAAREARGDRWSSLTNVIVRDGFIAPTYLVAGLLRQFEENWQAALNRFNRAVPHDAPPFVRIQRFQFYCWLLWGPSIPACTCERWDGSFVALQYGYGDENNSFPLLLERRQYQDDWKRFHANFVDESARALPLAVGWEFSGSLVWGPQINRSRSDFPSIYVVPADPARRQQFEGEPDDPPRRSVFDGLMLRADAIDRLNAPRLYYSAYVWMMFELCSEEMAPFYGAPLDRWKNLLPIFEHGNLADGETLLFSKQRLAEKAWRTVTEIERASPQVRVRYLCAIDDPGSVETDAGKHVLRFGLDDLPLVRRRRLRGLLARAALADAGELGVDDDLSAEELEAMIPRSPACARLFSRPKEREPITSCDLPTIIDDFYRKFLGVGL